MAAATAIGLVGLLVRAARWMRHARTRFSDELRFHPADRAEMEGRFARVLGTDGQAVD